jgi:hypothetical protein
VFGQDARRRVGRRLGVALVVVPVVGAVVHHGASSNYARPVDALNSWSLPVGAGVIKLRESEGTVWYNTIGNLRRAQEVYR